MENDQHGGMLLGRHTPAPETYAPHILHGISRSAARAEWSPAGALPFFGVDQWHAYELSWLDREGRPQAWVGRFRVPADSSKIVESKSLKLYLNSLNSARFASPDEARKTIVADVGAVVAAPVSLELMAVDSQALVGQRLPGDCLDGLPVSVTAGTPDRHLLQLAGGGPAEEQVYSHLLRSLCPVTGQPDWATIWIHYRGAQIERRSLLQYIISYRDHREFHEQCAERMFMDIHACCGPAFLHLQAFYTRRGGLDISPFRSTDPDARPFSRLDRQ